MRQIQWTLFLGLLLVVTAFHSCKQQAAKQDASSAISKDLPWSQRMAETIMYDFPEVWRMEEAESIKWSYTKGLVCSAFINLWKENGQRRYFDYAKAYADTLINDQGVIIGYKMDDYNIDHINPGKMLFELYHETEDPRYEIAIKTLRKQLLNHPRTEAGGFWHKKRYPHQMWLDGLYMGAPFYARYGVEYHEPDNVDDAVNWIIVMAQKARDPESGLLHHAWDESRQQRWADKETGLSSNFWGRGMGWYSMALVDILDYTGDHPRKVEISGIESYLGPARKAYQGILSHLIACKKGGRIVLSPVCAVAGLGGSPYRDGSFEYYINEKRRDNDPKAVGPFIMASLLYEAL